MESRANGEIALLEAAGVPRYWGVLQAFADSYYRYPTRDELREAFARWRSSRMDGYLVFAWSYAGNSLDDHPDLQKLNLGGMEVRKADGALADGP